LEFITKKLIVNPIKLQSILQQIRKANQYKKVFGNLEEIYKLKLQFKQK